MPETKPDKFDEVARQLLNKLKEFDIGSIDEPVGDDIEKNKQDVVAEFLRQKFTK